jgi:dGTPase
VFINGTADHYRTRLTHTIEMAAVGRTIARCVRANEDLVEAIALAHDIGHPPFGHGGERALDELMRDWGGFDHNVQSCRAVELLELQYPDFPGLNLTWEVRAGLRKHEWKRPGAELDGYPLGPHPMLEAQIADLADDLTYHAHDVDDALAAGLITPDDLRELELWRRAEQCARDQAPNAPEERRLRLAIRNLLDLQVEDVICTTRENLAATDVDSPEAVMNADRRIVDVSKPMRTMLAPLHAFLFQRVYLHPQVAEVNAQAVAMMRRLFMYYLEHPETMGRKARARIEQEGLWRTVCDYVAGMTDRYALEEYQRFGLG